MENQTIIGALPQRGRPSFSFYRGVKMATDFKSSGPIERGHRTRTYSKKHNDQKSAAFSGRVAEGSGAALKFLLPERKVANVQLRLEIFFEL
jgi:hypothetical protein